MYSNLRIKIGTETRLSYSVRRNIKYRQWRKKYENVSIKKKMQKYDERLERKGN